MDNNFIGEHLLSGQLGHLFVIISLVASMFSGYCYLMSVLKDGKMPAEAIVWKKMGRVSFAIHFLTIISVFICLYYIIANHLYEYHYAWEHSSNSMPMQYLLSCFWEGQQGSFMLWTFWNSFLGLIVLKTAKELETRTMTILALVQFLLCSMILGIYLAPEARIGATPFDLLRNAMQNAPIFARPDYLKLVADGNGLNVLLQNYWMVIHPPILFLGFSATLIPFVYCIAALWKGDYNLFIKPILAWSIFNGAVLGAGIMMGGAWAYESLNFGGYWAWDPVENASLVPWLTLIAGLHTLLEFKSTGRALPATLILLMLTHLLVWYSTFLTRTGILGSTSVHAFTGDGTSLSYHLLLVIGILMCLAVFFLVKSWKTLPRIKQEEGLWTREFWMFIGAAVLFISAIHITVMTSIPVWSPLAKIFSNKEFTLLDPVAHYNSVEVWIAILTGIFSGSVLFMKYKSENKSFIKPLAIVGVIALIISLIIGWSQKINQFPYFLMLFSACFGVVGSLYYGAIIQKGNLRKAGASIAHFGFGLALLGILLSSFNKHVLSLNNTGEAIQFGKKTEKENLKENAENVILYKGKPVKMGDYILTYGGDSAVSEKDVRVYYKINFERRDTVNNKTLETFTLYPDAFINPKGMKGLSANPATKHYWHKDVFTYINAINNSNKESGNEFKNVKVSEGDTILLEQGFMIFKGFSKGLDTIKFKTGKDDLGVTGHLEVFDTHAQWKKELLPAFLIQEKKYANWMDDSLTEFNLRVRFNLVVKENDKAETEIYYKEENPANDYVVLKALVFPYINVLWIGVMIMVFGFFTGLFSRIGEKIGRE